MIQQELPRGINSKGWEFYCPQGHKFYSPSKQFDEAFKLAFQEHCQCDCCKYGKMQTTWDAVGCSGGFLGHSGLKFRKIMQIFMAKFHFFQFQK